MELKIQSGIPIPTTTARKGTNIELLKSMKIGDSVFFDAPIVKRATRFYRVAKHLGAKIVIRKENDGQRMWLTGLPKQEGETAAPVVTAMTKTTTKKAKKKAAPKTAPKAKTKGKFVAVRAPRDPSKPTREQLRQAKRDAKAAAATTQGAVANA